MKLKNLSDGKIISIGEVNILPGEEKEIPVMFEQNPVLDVYVKNGFATVTGEPTKIEEEPVEDKEAEAAEELRKARLASLKGISEEALGSLAQELGINPAECKDSADVLKKVKVALRK